MHPRHILYFVKFPEPGRVKTRLAQSIGFEAAARLYRLLAEQNLEVLRSISDPPLAVCIHFDPPEKEAKVRDWLLGDEPYLAQRGRDLGERLRDAFAHAFERGASGAIAVGSDTIGLQPGFLREAFAGLERNDVILGPSRDGGYYLIGLSRPQSLLFQDIPWSTPRVLEATLTRIREGNLSLFLLPELEDLDRAENLNALELNHKGIFPR